MSLSHEARPRRTRRGRRGVEDERTRHPRDRGRHRRRRFRARRRDPRPERRDRRGARLGVGHLEPLVEARARRHPLPRAAQLPARARGADRARPAAAAPRAAPREARAVPLPAEQARLRAASTSVPAWRSTTSSAGPGGRPPGRAASPPPHARRRCCVPSRACSKDAFVGGLTYYDAQVDDARYVASLARTASSFYGAHVASRVGSRASSRWASASSA